MPKILSVDVGIRNLAFCIISYETIDPPKICKWGVFDLCPVDDLPSKCAYCSAKATVMTPNDLRLDLLLLKNKQNKFQLDPPEPAEPPYPVGMCVTHANKVGTFSPVQTKCITLKFLKENVILCESDEFIKLLLDKCCLKTPTKIHELKQMVQTGYSEIHEKKKKKDLDDFCRRVFVWFNKHTCSPIVRVKASEVKLMDAGKRFAELAKEHDIFNGVDVLIIENQIGPKAVRMKSMQEIITTVAIFAGVKDTIGVSSAWKLSACTKVNKQETVQPQIPSSYAKHKSDGITRCREWLQYETKQWKDVFEGSIKKDDLADSYLQAIYMYETIQSESGKPIP